MSDSKRNRRELLRATISGLPSAILFKGSNCFERSHSIMASPTACASESISMAQGPREAITYSSATAVTVYRRFAHMGGFRFRGHYSKGRAPVFSMPEDRRIHYNSMDCPVLSVVKNENWVACFAVANDGASEATLVTMPFLRLASPVGQTAALIAAGEGNHDLATTMSYSWSSTNNLAGTDCLVINEGLQFSGRITTVVGNSPNSIALDNMTGITAGGFILPAPPGYQHYVYLGSFYFDSAEVRNVYDDGRAVRSKMMSIQEPAAYKFGERPPPGDLLNFAGYISPLATATIVDSSGSLSTASKGYYAEYFDPDGSAHVIRTFSYTKATTTTETYYNSEATVPFSQYQVFYYSNAGLAAQRIMGQMSIVGWVEP